MSGDGYINKTMKDLTERKNLIAEALTSGSARSFDEYKSMCGEIRGLAIAHELLNDLVRKMENDDD